MNKLVSFLAGGVLGAAVGAAISSLTAPQSGPQLQDTMRSAVAEVKRAGDEAQAEAVDRFRERYRAAVNDPNALADRA